MPEGVATLVESMSAAEVKLALINVNHVEPSTVIVQTGGYAEHRITSVLLGGGEVPTDRPEVAVHPGRAWS